MSRYQRHYDFFGKDGQEHLRSLHVVIVGAGGTGSHVIQQLAYLGIGAITVIDDEELEESNLNRYVTAYHDDPIPGSKKVDLAERLVGNVDPEIAFKGVFASAISENGFKAINRADTVFGCVDNDGTRFILNELCLAYEIPYFDGATDILPDGEYGGRICITIDREGCLYCHDVLDRDDVDEDLLSSREKEARQGIYGVPEEALGVAGPSVVSINGVVSSLLVTEFALWVTGIRDPRRLLTYRGNWGIVSIPDPSELPREGCYYCQVLRGQGDAADIGRYLKVDKGGS